jgi:hypothetical protein
MGACALLPPSSLCFTHHTPPYRLRRQWVPAASKHAEQGPVSPWYMVVGMPSATLYHTCHLLTKTVLHSPWTEDMSASRRTAWHWPRHTICQDGQARTGPPRPDRRHRFVPCYGDGILAAPGGGDAGPSRVRGAERFSQPYLVMLAEVSRRGGQAEVGLLVLTAVMELANASDQYGRPT